MWYPATVAAPTTEPVTLAQAKAQARVDGSDEDAGIIAAIAAARAHIEKACGVRFASRSGVVMKCDGFADLARLPEAPVSAIASITYLDTAGASQTLSTDVYELRADGIEAAVVLKYNQTWPAIQPGSRITVTATVGYAATPEDITLAMLMLVSQYYDNRNAVVIGETAAELPFAVNALICNHRRGV